MINRYSLAVIAIALSFGACSRQDPLTVVIPTDKTVRAKALESAMKQLPPQDRDRLQSYLARCVMAEALTGIGVQPGTTVGKALEEERKEEASQHAEETKQKAAREKKAEQLAAHKRREAEMRSILAISFEGFKMEQSSIYEIVNVSLALRNNGAKAITGVKGTAIFTDAFGDKVAKDYIKIETQIEPNAEVKWSDRNADIDGRLKAAATKKTTFSFRPEVILFADGTKLELPAASDYDLAGMDLP